jgi:hypothetical protein
MSSPNNESKNQQSSSNTTVTTAKKSVKRTRDEKEDYETNVIVAAYSMIWRTLLIMITKTTTAMIAA